MRIFEVKELLDLKEFYGDVPTVHFNDERQLRESVASDVGIGNIILSAIVDTDHPNGLEVHQLTDTGVITIFNKNSKRLITKLIARPGQVRRYYTPFNKVPPRNVLDIAFKHQQQSLNKVQ